MTGYLGWTAILRLGLVQTALGAIVVADDLDAQSGDRGGNSLWPRPSPVR